MKKVKYLILIALMTAVITGYSQISNKDEMVKRIFAVFKNKDEKGFINLFPNSVTIKEFIQALIKADTSVKLGNVLKTSLDGITDSSLQVELRKDFKKYNKKAEVKGVDWSRSVYMSYKADSTFESKDGIKVSKLTGTIYFNMDNKEYFFKFGNTIWFENKGWYDVEITRVDEKSNENENVWEGSEDSIRMAGLDSMRMIDSTIKAEEIKPVQKTKQPVQNKPIKGKTPPPARKPE